MPPKKRTSSDVEDSGASNSKRATKVAKTGAKPKSKDAPATKAKPAAKAKAAPKEKAKKVSRRVQTHVYFLRTDHVGGMRYFHNN